MSVSPEEGETWKDLNGQNTSSILRELLALEQRVQENRSDVLSSLITEYLQLDTTEQNKVNHIVCQLAVIFCPTTAVEQFMQKLTPSDNTYYQTEQFVF